MIVRRAGQAIIKQFEPETAHNLTIKALKTGLGVPGSLKKPDARLSMRLKKANRTLMSPVGLAAGFDKNADVPSQMAAFGFGLVECGTVTPRPQPGNDKPRLFRLTEDRAVINRMGFNNGGLDAFVSNMKRYSGLALVGANVGANKTSDDKIADYETCIEAVAGIANYITINISSPNTPGLRGLQDKGALSELLIRCQGALERAMPDDHQLRPVFLKVAPDLDDEAIADIVQVVETDGAWLTGLIVSNTTLARPETLQSAHKDEQGGLSGEPLFESSTNVLAQFARHLEGRFDLIGAGGVHDAETAFAKIAHGASAVQLYSALVYEGPELVEVIHEGLIKLIEERGFRTLQDAVGTAL